MMMIIEKGQQGGHNASDGENESLVKSIFLRVSPFDVESYSGKSYWKEIILQKSQ